MFFCRYMLHSFGIGWSPSGCLLVSVPIYSYFGNTFFPFHYFSMIMKQLKPLLTLLAAALLLASCAKEDSAPAEGTPVPGMLANGVYNLASGSLIEWKATKKVTGGHNGTLIVSGSFDVADGSINGGNFDVDMNSIVVEDLKDSPEDQAKLVGHLKSADFFDVQNNPTAQFVILNVTPSTDGKGTHVISGSLTIKGNMNDVSFPANVKVNEDGSVSISAEFEIDRTKWDVKYGSGTSFPDMVADKVINDGIQLKFNLMGRP